MVELRPVPTRNELADIGTKALAWPALVRLRDVLFGNVPTVSHLLNRFLCFAICICLVRNRGDVRTRFDTPRIGGT